MEKILSKTPSFLSTLVHRFVREGVNNNFLWRVVLAILLVLAVLFVVFAWLLYGDVTAETPLPVVPKHTQAGFSLDDLRGVINFYQQKENDFRSVRSSPPMSPPVSVESGVVVAQNPDQNTDQLLPL